MLSFNRIIAIIATLLAFVSTVQAAPDYWDSRLSDFCGLELIDVASQVTPGRGYWRLAEGVFEDEIEAAGGHYIFVRAEKADGTPIVDQKFFNSWPYSYLVIDESQCAPTNGNWACALTKGAGIDDYFGNVAMWGNCPPGACDGVYNAWISETSSPAGLIGLSDKIVGMWMHDPTPGHTGCNAHVNFRLTYRWTLAGTSEPPTITASPTLIQHTISEGDSLSNSTFTVTNTGGWPLEYTVNENVSWLGVTPISGTSSGETDTITITYNTSALAGGNTYTTQIQIIDGDATNSPQNVTVQITVTPPAIPGDMDFDGDVDQTDFGMFQACLSTSGGIQTDPDCQIARLDGDPDVDQDDYAIFALCMTGPDIMGDVNCDQP